MEPLELPLDLPLNVVLNSPIAHTTPTGYIPEAPELGTPCYKETNAGSQQCPLQRGSTVGLGLLSFHTAT